MASNEGHPYKSCLKGVNNTGYIIQPTSIYKGEKELYDHRVIETEPHKLENNYITSNTIRGGSDVSRKTTFIDKNPEIINDAPYRKIKIKKIIDSNDIEPLPWRKDNDFQTTED